MPTSNAKNRFLKENVLLMYKEAVADSIITISLYEKFKIEKPSLVAPYLHKTHIRHKKKKKIEHMFFNW
ncbi:hypothetical protein B4V02_11690 [Paenibacillus kribbensis]|uniref:Uncharacterized protein n=1 Tax=Paenibacillus kribbensis TaxID=172713 RepID=A0A222WLD8_9BACL|nr:hypothetical protein B4V02_11690 [Paenibacillus kribbensis]